MPLDVLVLPACLPEACSHAAVEVLNPCLGSAADVVSCDLGNVDAEIDREQAVPGFPEAGNIGRAGRIRSAHLNVHDLGEAISGNAIERTSADPEAAFRQERAQCSRGGSTFGASDRGVLVSAYQGSGLGFSLGQDQGRP